MGIHVDIFPFDCLALEEPLQNKQIKRARLHVRLLYLYYSRHVNVPHKGLLGIAEKAVGFVGHYVLKTFCSPQQFIKGFNRYCTPEARGDKTGNELACLAYSKLRIFPKDVLYPTSLGIFEGRTLPLPGNAPEYLTKVYGNWEALPSEEDRKTHSPLKVAFDKNMDSETPNTPSLDIN
jgi:lipopolysaccharide cholinephosphotransferase